MRPFVLSIAGFDPSGGAGVLADIKTFENIGVQGFAACTAVTFQRDDLLESVDWLPADKIIHQAELLLQKFTVAYCKIGLVEDFESLGEIIRYLSAKDIKIILDPILKSSSGFQIHRTTGELLPLLEKVFVLTPNFDEMKFIFNGNMKSKAARNILQKTNIFLKGGHNTKRLGVDYLFTKDYAMPLAPKKGKYFEKHGSGCILSSAITAYLAMGNDLKASCFKAKEYTANALASNETLLAYHHFKSL